MHDGEDPFTMLLAVVWPDHDWSKRALHARLTSCPRCGCGDVGCNECGNTRLITAVVPVGAEPLELPVELVLATHGGTAVRSALECALS